MRYLTDRTDRKIDSWGAYNWRNALRPPKCAAFGRKKPRFGWHRPDLVWPGFDDGAEVDLGWIKWSILGQCDNTKGEGTQESPGTTHGKMPRDNSKGSESDLRQTVTDRKIDRLGACSLRNAPIPL